MRPALIALAAVAVATVAGCTGVPTSSSPQIIEPVAVSQPATPAQITPHPGADPRTIVQDFLKASALGGTLHTQAAAFLTAPAKAHFSDSTVTVINNATIAIPAIQPDGTETVDVTANPIGSVTSSANSADAAGVYLPVLSGDGTGGSAQTYTFTLSRQAGQWRIAAPLPATGLLIDLDSFTNVYRARSVYFYDLAGIHLIADPRYTALTDPAELATWLVQQVVAGPSDAVQDAVSLLDVGSQTSPQAGAPQVTVVVGGALTTIEIAGASELAGKQRDQLAGEVAATISSVVPANPMTITDNGRPVRIPAANGTIFTASLSSGALYQPPSISPVYFVRNPGPHGAVIDQAGQPLPGKLGSGGYALQSVALAGDPSQLGTLNPGQLARLRVAGLTNAGKDEHLVIGTGISVSPTAVTGAASALSRPAWAPNADEVWIGNGTVLERVSSGGQVWPVSLAAPAGAGAPTGRIESVQLSPDGSRVLLVLSTGPAAAQLWVGAVVRPPAGGPVHVDGLTQISPANIVIKDAAWSSPVLLYAVGSAAHVQNGGVYVVQVDGSGWISQSTANLPPGAADSVAVASGAAWVSVDGTVWQLNGDVWESPVGATGSTAGVNPTTLQ